MTYRGIADALLARRQKTLDAPGMAKFGQKRDAGGAVFQMNAGAVEQEVAMGVGVRDQERGFLLSRKKFHP